MTDISFKVSLCGEPGVGKTSIALRQAQGSFPVSHHPTLGANFLIWNTMIDGKDIRLIIGDSGSQERFLPVLPKYFQGSAVAALIYDITNRESFDKLKYWKDLLNESVGEIPIVIVGNKTDLEEKRKVAIEEGEKLASDFETEYFEVSAKEDNNLYPVFRKIVNIALEKEK
ncbi:MAG: GTP-binding protein [Candidatus Heimdallarchaeota archaeon]|nr:GTP-binding protein [Candidatus Heimdallarchaeota archaeon]